MTHAEIGKRIGKITQLAIDGGERIWVDCLVRDHKSAYGRDLWLVAPVRGSGSRWVSGSSLGLSVNDKSEQGA